MCYLFSSICLGGPAPVPVRQRWSHNPVPNERQINAVHATAHRHQLINPLGAADKGHNAHSVTLIERVKYLGANARGYETD